MKEPTITITTEELKRMGSQIKLSDLRKAIPNLEALCNRAMDHADDFKNAVKVVSINTNVDASVLRKLIKARCNDNVKKVRPKAEQMSLLFDVIGDKPLP